jgi:hypothetical protein
MTKAIKELHTKRPTLVFFVAHPRNLSNHTDRQARTGDTVLVKGTVSRDFLLFFFMNPFQPSPRVFHLDRIEFFQKFAEIFASQGAPPVSTTPVAKLPTVSTTPVANLPPVSATPVANFSTISASIVDTGGKFATSVNDTGGKFATGDVDTGGK